MANLGEEFFIKILSTLSGIVVYNKLTSLTRKSPFCLMDNLTLLKPIQLMYYWGISLEFTFWIYHTWLSNLSEEQCCFVMHICDFLGKDNYNWEMKSQDDMKFHQAFGTQFSCLGVYTEAPQILVILSNGLEEKEFLPKHFLSQRNSSRALKPMLIKNFIPPTEL